MVARRHLALPAVNLHGRFDERTEEEARVAVGHLLELDRQIEIVVIFARGQIAVFLVGAALGDQIARIVDVPQFGAVLLPAREIPAVEEFDRASRLARQLLDLHVAERCRIAVILQADHTAPRQSVFGGIGPFSAVLQCEPLVGVGVEFENFLTVEPVLDVAVVVDDARVVPFALRIEPHLGGVGQVHGVVDAQPLPRFELGGGVGLLPARFVDELVFGPRDVGHLEVGVFDHVVEHSAVAAVGEFPVPVEDEVFVLLAGDDVARQVAAVAVRLDAAVDRAPGHGERVAVVVFPRVERLAVEEQLPAVGDLLFAERVVSLCASRRQQQRESDARKRRAPVEVRDEVHGYE